MADSNKSTVITSCPPKENTWELERPDQKVPYLSTELYSPILTARNCLFLEGVCRMGAGETRLEKSLAVRFLCFLLPSRGRPNTKIGEKTAVCTTRNILTGRKWKGRPGNLGGGQAEMEIESVPSPDARCVLSLLCRKRVRGFVSALSLRNFIRGRTLVRFDAETTPLPNICRSSKLIA